MYFFTSSIFSHPKLNSVTLMVVVELSVLLMTVLIVVYDRIIDVLHY
jgi:hypothetical protein